MRLQVTHGVAVTALMLFSAVIPAHSRADELSLSPLPAADAPDLVAPIRTADVTKAITQVASAVEPVMPPPAETALPVPVPAPQAAIPAKTAQHHKADDQLAAKASYPDRHHLANNSDFDQKNIRVKAIGPCLVGKAAWYGGRYIGRRTSSGIPLDQIHATAAHRTLPLNSLVRVTNLSNGRSVIVRINDRGPVSDQLLIDMSPKAADELAMKTAGIVPVSIEQVVEVADASK
jgi:rare lipoprotein A